MKKIIILFSIFSSLHVSGQPFFNVHDQNYQTHSGYIEFKNEKKISGVFKYAFWEFPNCSLKSYSSKNKMVKRYRIRQISKVVLAGSDTWLTKKDSTYFIVYGKWKQFYRQLTFGKNLQLYDGFFNVDEYVGLLTDYFLVKTKDGRFIEFNSAKKLIPWLKENSGSKIQWHKDITVQQIIRQLNGMG